MKKLYLFALLLCLASQAVAQTLKIHSGAITTAVAASEAGEMLYSADGTALTIMGRTYSVSEIDSITVDRSTVAPSTVAVNYQGASARVLVAADVAPQLSISVSGADVVVYADAALATEVTYALSGASADGSFFMEGEYKSTLVLDNLTLSNTRGAAIDIANGKRLSVVIPDGTQTTLSDGVGGTHKACFFVNGHPEFEGGGTLQLVGNTKHAFASDEYTELKKDFGKIIVTKAVTDGMHIEQYFHMKGGEINISGTGGDCIDVSVTKDSADELNGQVLIEGGSITMDVAAEDVKGLKSDDIISISGGSIKATVSGNGTKGISSGTDLFITQPTATATLIDMTVTGTTYMPDDPELESKCRGIKVKGDFTFDGGTIRISATGKKSKAISVDGVYTYKSGSINCAVD